MEAKIIFSTQEQTTERKFNSMRELAKEFKAQYSQTLCNRKCLHTATTQAGIYFQYFVKADNQIHAENRMLGHHNH